MLNFISRYVSVISLAAVAALSLFNIGYFWKIGLHFIGLIDLSNLVYSAALALTAVTLWLTVAAAVVPRSPTLPKILALALLGAAIMGWGIWNFGPRSPAPQLAENGAILLGMTISGSAFLTWSLKRYRASNVWEWRDIAVALLIIFGTIFQAGSFTAALELSDRFTYAVSTKSGILENARILRSSSSGFILVVDGSVAFVPNAEIRIVKNTAW